MLEGAVYNIKVKTHLDLNQLDTKQMICLLKELEAVDKVNAKVISKLKKKYPKNDGSLFKKSDIVVAYRKLAGKHGLKKIDNTLIKRIAKKPIRTQSGVTPVTVLTKPFPCPGKCIFCPGDVRMPKSYLSDEPGAQRAERNNFDPYLQTYNRLQALYEIGHNIDKVEIIVLGGTWSYYPEKYQIWFIKECFRALNDFLNKDDRQQVLAHYKKMILQLKKANTFVLSDDPEVNKQKAQQYQQELDQQKTYNKIISELYMAPEKLGGFDKYQTASWEELEKQQKINETAGSRCVGLVIETRPDNISQEEVIRIRRLGCTKAQIGIQSLNDEVLKKNKRGHDVAATVRAFALLRQAGFKIHGHWMANLYGSSVEEDKKDFLKLFSDKNFHPDELKIYPCSLIQSAELMDYYDDHLWSPYSYPELLDILTFVLKNTPEYCRLTRIIRDIPSTDIVAGNKKTNFRQIAEQELEKAGKHSKDIRSREIRDQHFDVTKVKLKKVKYETSTSTENFLQFVVDGKILAFLRLSLPTRKPFIAELADSAVIREIHVYGPAVAIGKKDKDKAQHGGFGTRLIDAAKEIAHQAGFRDMAVISGIGTREYYRKKGFQDGKLYQHICLV